MKLYSRPLSPFASRCRIQIYAKNLPVELVPVPVPNPEDYRAMNPIGKVPALEVDGAIIPESQVICEFLEARFPEPPLLPKDPFARADTKLLSRFADLYLLPHIDPLADHLDPSRRDEATVGRRLEELSNRLDQLETLLVGRPFAGGTELSLADCALVPTFFFLTRLLPVFGFHPFEKRPKLDTWWDAAPTHPAVARVLDEMGAGLARFMKDGGRARIGPARHPEPRKAEDEPEVGAFLTKYICQKLVGRMMEASNKQSFGGERCFATVMFVDIHGFSTLAERFEPERVMEILNRNLGVVIDAVFRHDGAVLQLLGDGALVVFGVHKKRDDDVQRAARSALEIHADLRTLQTRVPEEEHIGVAIGIDCGDVVCGNIGHKERLEFGLVGDTVNVAARMQSLARSGETLLTSRVAEAIGGDFTIEYLEETMVKGRANPVRVCKLAGSRIALGT